METVVGGIFIEAALCRSHVHIPAANFSRSSKHSSTLNLKTLPSFGGEDCGTLQDPPHRGLDPPHRGLDPPHRDGFLPHGDFETLDLNHDPQHVDFVWSRVNFDCSHS